LFLLIARNEGAVSMNWELKQTPKVGRRLAQWIWFAGIALVVVAGLALLAWKSVRHDRNLEQKNTGALLWVQPVAAVSHAALYFRELCVSKGSTT
jgi:hypothetical protein